MFQLTQEETAILVSQSVIPSRRHLGGFLPYAFTEQGVAMLSSVLHSEQAVEVNIAILRAFVRLRQLLSSFLLSHLFLGGPQPPEPFPGCGTDGTRDAIPCDALPAVCR